MSGYVIVNTGKKDLTGLSDKIRVSNPHQELLSLNLNKDVNTWTKKQTNKNHG